MNEEDKYLKELFETKIEAAEKATLLAIKNLELQINNDEVMRQIIHDQISNCMTRTEYNIQHSKIKDDITDLRESRAELKGKASVNSVYASYGLSLLVLIVMIIKLIIG